MLQLILCEKFGWLQFMTFECLSIMVFRKIEFVYLVSIKTI